MFYDQLPWYIYILLALLGGGIILFYVRKRSIYNTKLFLIGQSMLIVVSVLASVEKFGEVLKLHQLYLKIISLLMVIFTILGVVILIYEAYNSAGNQLQKKKRIKMLIITMVIIISVCTLVLFLPS